ncbi:MAG: sn-glycerol-3-phosphate ABC transporter ATP-binding protein UgpC [Pseudomonadota bacterium]
MAGLTLSSVTKTYPGGVTAVSQASIDVADGEFIVLVGPSGCGKSTLLRMIAGLETVTSGDVLIDGARVNDMEPGDRDIAMVFQNYALNPHMSVIDNMAYGLRNQGMARAQITERIAEAAETLQLTAYLKRKPRQLSGGQRQRVAMGRAIVREPKVFLFDEPLSNLDAKLRTHMRSELKDLHRRLNGTFVFVTHDQVEAMSLADRIVILNEGRVEQVGAPMQLYHRPASTFVAEFIGSPPMNLIPLASPLGQQMTGGMGLPPGATTLGLRPEALTVGPAEDAPLAGPITLCEALGAETLLHVLIPSAGARLTLRASGEAALGEGDTIGLYLRETATPCWFDADGRLLPA